MMYPTKTALVIRLDLLSWQIANVAAFLSGGLAGTYPEIVGEPYRDGDGRLYTPMIREPVFVHGATSAELARTHGHARRDELASCREYSRHRRSLGCGTSCRREDCRQHAAVTVGSRSHIGCRLPLNDKRQLQSAWPTDDGSLDEKPEIGRRRHPLGAPSWRHGADGVCDRPSDE